MILRPQQLTPIVVAETPLNVFIEIHLGLWVIMIFWSAIFLAVVNTSLCILFATFWKIPFAWSSCLILFHIHIDMRECHFPVHIRMHMTSCLFWIVFGLLWEAWDCWLLTCNGSSHSVLICFIWHDSLNDSIFILNCQGIVPPQIQQCYRYGQWHPSWSLQGSCLCLEFTLPHCK